MKTATHFVSLSETPFSRRGSYLAFFNDTEARSCSAGQRCTSAAPGPAAHDGRHPSLRQVKRRS